MGETPESFFKEYIFTYAHDASIKVVALGNVDGATVDSLIWEYANHNDSKFTSKTKIIKKSQPFGIPPVVVKINLNPLLKQKLKEAFLNVHLDEKGRKILKKMIIKPARIAWGSSQISNRIFIDLFNSEISRYLYFYSCQIDFLSYIINLS